MNPNESVLKPNIVKDLIGDIDEITIFQNELGYSNLDKELCLLIGETDCNGINEIINKYIDHLYEIILKMIDEENAKKEQERQKVIEEEKQKNKKLKKTKIVFSLIVICFAIIIFYVNVIVPNDKYNQAVELSNSGQYEEAIKIYKELGNYKNSQRLILENKYNLAVEFTNNKQFEKAIEIFAELGDYKDSKLLLGINKFFLPE